MQIRLDFLLVFLCLTYSLDLTQDAVLHRWNTLTSDLRSTVELRILQGDLTEHSLIKILSQEMPRLQKLSFSLDKGVVNSF